MSTQSFFFSSVSLPPPPSASQPCLPSPCERLTALGQRPTTDRLPTGCRPTLSSAGQTFCYSSLPSDAEHCSSKISEFIRLSTGHHCRSVQVSAGVCTSKISADISELPTQALLSRSWPGRIFLRTFPSAQDIAQISLIFSMCT